MGRGCFAFVEVYYANDKIKDSIENNEQCRRSYGLDIQKAIFKRLDAAKAAKTLHDLRNVPGKWHGPLTGPRKGQFATSLNKNWRLVFVPFGEPEEYTIDGTVDWKKVISIKIVDIVDYHGE